MADAGSSVPEAARAAKWVEALWPDGITYAGDITRDGGVRRVMAMADREVAAASVELQQEVDRLSAECEALRGTVAEERATTGRAAFIAGAEWADDACPVHAYPKLLEAEADKRYPRAALASPGGES